MAGRSLGLREALSFALGGIIGGGIFAVLGVVAELAGPTAWLAYALSGLVVLATGYSYVTLNDRLPVGDGAGGAVSFVEAYLDRPTLAGAIGWTLLVGYVGTVAMYAYAFGAYFGAIFGITRLPVLGVPSRPVLSVAVVVLFVGVNLLGVRESGLVEDLLVALKLLIVGAFGLVGIWYGYTNGLLDYGVAETVADPANPIVAAGVAFVSFEGWQLLFYDQERFEDPHETIRTAVYASIPVATLSYVLVAFVTLSLVERPAIVAHPDLALAIAARAFSGQMGYLLIGVAAVASTASAINATLFSTALFAKGMSTDGLLPDQIAPTRAAGMPTSTLLVIGAAIVVFTAFGSLGAITEFASLAFIVVFAVVNGLAYRDPDVANDVVPLVGLIGTVTFFWLFLWHLVTAQFSVFVLVAVIALAVAVVEGLYFEREEIRNGLRSVRKRV